MERDEQELNHAHPRRMHFIVYNNQPKTSSSSPLVFV
jgi:hypothetical protein